MWLLWQKSPQNTKCNPLLFANWYLPVKSLYDLLFHALHHQRLFQKNGFGQDEKQEKHVVEASCGYKYILENFHVSYDCKIAIQV